MTTFFALLALLANAAVLTVAAVALLARARGELPAWALELRLAVGQVALWFAWVVALTATLGSLYLSERLKYPPCELCWYQRIAMYPLAVILLVAAIRRSADVRPYALPLCAIGVAIGTYHYLHEWFPDAVASGCSTQVPCSTVWVRELGFVSIPYMAVSGFLLVAVLLLLARPATDPGGDPREAGETRTEVPIP